MAVGKRTSNRNNVTMRDVARLANVSQSTVSRVLSGSVDAIPISEETRERVLDAVQKLDYHPNLHAGSLRGQKTQMIAILIADIANPFYHPMVRAVQDVANRHQYDVMVANSDHLRAEEYHFLESVIRRPVDGVLAVPYHLTDEDFDHLMARTGAIVSVVGQHIRHPDVEVAFSDDAQATDDAVTWLCTAKGHARIGFIGVTDDFSAAARRRRAFESAIRRAGLDLPDSYKELGDWSPESGFQAMGRLLAQKNPPSAVFACNDLMAIGALEAVRQAGKRIPDDVAVIGFDDIPPASWVRPRLTTIAQRPYEMGRVLTEAIFERLTGLYSGPGRRFDIPCHFVEREST